MKHTEEEQTTLNELIQCETGVSPTLDAIPIKLPTPERHRTRPGFVSKFVHIPEGAWELIEAHLEAHLEAHDLDEKKFLTRLLANAATQLEKYSPTKGEVRFFPTTQREQ